MSVSHQQAMLDWLHWGGQLVLIGGAGPGFSIFGDSFLASYLPADPTGESQLLGESDLKPLADTYPPPVLPSLPPDADRDPDHRPVRPEPFTPPGRPYRNPVPIHAAEGSPRLRLGVACPPGHLDHFPGQGQSPPAGRRRAGGPRADHDADDQPDRPCARLVAGDRYPDPPRGPATTRGGPRRAHRQRRGAVRSARATLEGPDLSWYRITSRDAGAEGEACASAGGPGGPHRRFRGAPVRPADRALDRRPGLADGGGRGGFAQSHGGRGMARHHHAAPGLPRPAGEGRRHHRPELAVRPQGHPRLHPGGRPAQLAGLPVGAQSPGMGLGRGARCWPSASPSAWSGWPPTTWATIRPATRSTCWRSRGGTRGRTSPAFASIYATGRGKYTISYPNDPTALALAVQHRAVDRRRGCRHVRLAIVSGPRAAGLHRAAAKPGHVPAPSRCSAWPGAITVMDGEGSGAGERTLVNGTDLELRDAVLVDVHGPEQAPRDLPGDDRARRLRSRWPPAGRPPFRHRSKGIDGPDPRRCWRAPQELGEPAREFRRAPAGRLGLAADGGADVRARAGPSPGHDGRAGPPPLRQPTLARGAHVTISWPVERRSGRSSPSGSRCSTGRGLANDRGDPLHQAVRRFRRRRRPELLHRQGGDLRLHRPQRRGQEHDHPLPGHPAAADLGRGPRRRPLGHRRPDGRPPRDRLHARRLRRLRRHEGLGVPRFLRRRLRDPPHATARRSSARCSSCST